MPAGKARIRGGVGTSVDLRSKIDVSATLDPHIKRGHKPISKKAKKELSRQLLKALSSAIGFERTAPAPTATELRRQITKAATAARRWKKNELSESSAWKERLFDALSALNRHGRAYVWDEMRTIDRKRPRNDALELFTPDALLQKMDDPPTDRFHDSIRLLARVNTRSIKTGSWTRPYMMGVIPDAIRLWTAWTGRSASPNNDKRGRHGAGWPFGEWFSELLNLSGAKQMSEGTIEKMVRAHLKNVKINRL